MLAGHPVASTGKAARKPDDVSVTVSVDPSIQISPQDRGRENFLKYGVRLYQAALDGDWETAEGIFNKDPFWIKAPITKRNDTVLHIAVAAKHPGFVRKLVDKMILAEDHLESKTILGNTAFCIAASSGNVEIAKIMMDENSQLPNIKGSSGMTPLLMAILLGHKNMVKYLQGVTDDHLLNNDDRIQLLTCAIEADLYDVAFDILDKKPELAVQRNGGGQNPENGETVLHKVAQRDIGSLRSEQSTWKTFLNRWTNLGEDEDQRQLRYACQVVQKAWNEVIKEDEDTISSLIGLPWRLLFEAAKIGNFEFLKILIRSYPDVIWKVDTKRKSIFHYAIEYRHVEIFKLIHEIGAIKGLIATYTDDDENNMLHLAANIAPSERLNCVSGAALQMQRELLWFEAVKHVVQPQYVVAKNASGETPSALFTKAHKELREQGEEWMKKTAESCTLVATLITTVTFTAAFTLPGGNNQDTGSPLLLKRASFMVFAISNAVSLFSSSTSILMFLSILTSRYAEQDFLKSLPFKLMVGLTSLFVCLASMMIAFTATFFITFQDGAKWIPIPIALLAAIPVLLFAFQQFPVLLEVYHSTYKSWTLLQSSDKDKLSWQSEKQKSD